MARKSRQNPEIREFILNNVTDHPGDIGPLTAEKFELSRTSVSRYMGRLVEEGLVEAEGQTRGRSYKLRNFISESFDIKASQGVAEDAIWRFRILPLIESSSQEVPKNVIDICQYGFTEMLNNVFDHSASIDCTFSYEQNFKTIKIWVIDNGIGVFQKIQDAFGLDDARSALLELSKGKLTSQPRQHSGEGIFFTSRMFDLYHLASEGLTYQRKRKDGQEWLVDFSDTDIAVKGTIVMMEISIDADWTTRDIFRQFESDDRHFLGTHVPIKLAQYGDEQLVSRSQAKRILTRLDQFSEVLLDFEGVEDAGRAFIDEVFRVYRLDHSETKMRWVNASSETTKLIVNAMSEIGEPPK